MKGNLGNLSLQLQNDFEELMSRTAKEKKSKFSIRGYVFEKKTDEKLKEIEKLDEVIEDLGNHSKQIGKEKWTGYFIETVSLTFFLMF